MKMRKYGILLLLVMALVIATFVIPAMAVDETVYYVKADGTGDYTDLFAAIKALPAAGGKIVVASDLTITASANPSVHTWTAKTGKITVTGENNPTITFTGPTKTKNVIECTSEIEFNNLTLDHTCAGGSTEFYCGPKVVIGQNMNFLVNGSAIPVGYNNNNGAICFRGGNYNVDCADTHMEFYSGRFSYIQGGNNKKEVTNSITIIVHPGVTVTDFVQCGGTQKNVKDVDCTIDGANVGYVYLSGYNTTGNVTGNVNLKIEDSAITALYGPRYTAFQGLSSVANTISGNVNVTLDNASIGTVNFKNLSGSGSKSLTLKNCEGQIADDLSSWTAVSLIDSIVEMTKAYAGPTDASKVSIDADSKLLVPAGTSYPAIEGIEPVSGGEGGGETPNPENPDPVIPDGDNVVYLNSEVSASGDGKTPATAVKTLEEAFAALPQGGTIKVVGTYTFGYDGVSGSPMLITFPSSGGKICITSADINNLSTLRFDTKLKTNVQFLSPIEFTNINWNFDHMASANGKNGNMNLYSGPSLTIGEGVTTYCEGCGGTTSSCLAIRGGWYNNSAAPAVTGDDYSSRDIEFTVLSGKWSYVQGAHESAKVPNYAPVGSATINIGGTADILSRVQVTGSNGGSNHGNVTVNVTGGKVNEIVMLGHGASGYVATIYGDVNINITGGTVTKINTKRTAYEKLEGDLTLAIGGTATVGTVTFDATYVNAAKNQVINLSGTGSLTSISGSAWDAINVLAGAEFDFLGAYNASLVSALNVEDGAVLQLNAANNTTVPSYNKVGPNETGKVILLTEHIVEAVSAKAAGEHVGGWNAHYRCTVCDKYFTDEFGVNETTLEALTIPATGSLNHHDYDGKQDEGTHILDVTGGQGNAIYGNILVACNKQGDCTIYDMLTGNEIANFHLGSFNNQILPSGTAANGTAAKDWENHSNQIMFGPAKFAESDPLPLLYVTTGNSGKHDGTGAYIVKMAVERIRYSETRGWYAETVQIIEFNDVDNIPDQEGNPYKQMNNNNNAADDVLTNMYDSATGKFLYVSGNGYDASKGYQKIGWGWPAWCIDSDPTADTAGKIYLFSARYRTTRAYEPKNKTTYGIADYFDGGNAYIVTELNMPALPTSESDPAYGATVTLYPKDIEDQFELEYTYGFTQGGTMYQGRIYYSFGNGKNADASNAAYAKYVTNAIQVVDIASQRFIAKLDLTSTNMGGAREPECCSIWNGELMLGMNGPNGYEMYSLGYVAIDGETSDPSCTENSKTEILCSLCGEVLGERVNEGTKKEHSFDGVGGRCTNGCDKKECEYTGDHEPVYVHVEGTNTHHKVCILCESMLDESVPCHDEANDRDHTCDNCDNTAALTEHQSDSVACCDGSCIFCGMEMPATEDHDWSDKDGVCNTCDNTCTSIMNGHHYDDGCDAECGICGYVRDAEHAYLYACDAHCMNCGELTNEDAAHKIVHVEAKDPTCFEYGNIEYWTCEYCHGCWDNENATGMPLNAMSVRLQPEHTAVVHMEAVAPGCHYIGNIEYWVCYDCEGVWQDEDLTQVTNIKNVILPALESTATHVEAKAPTCDENGNKEYWYCDECEQVWENKELTALSNIKNVQIGATGHNLKHYAAVAPTCDAEGNVEYWRCETCGAAFLDEAATKPVAKDRWVLGATGHTLTEVDYVAPTATEDGNINYWYCEVCEKYFADAEGTEEITYEETIIPANPETGDSTMLVSAAILALLGITGTALLVTKKNLQK